MLARAITRNSKGEVKRLIKNGADVDALFPGGEHNPLTFATTGGHLEMVKILLDAGANPYVRFDGDCPIHTASQVWICVDRW